ncbi:hypothetical protein D3C86_1878580 [compost metagenome]
MFAAPIGHQQSELCLETGAVSVSLLKKFFQVASVFRMCAIDHLFQGRLQWAIEFKYPPSFVRPVQLSLWELETDATGQAKPLGSG